ncbi:hypothetical protein [Peptostreptococcus porci]|uniref:hypothetical protein n=1 Tax=Peptostreptococcus porci TaxID=2652282 RepID=UPI002A913CFD|nr:hypothetical protein [Peptostreptococcus porci]MDY5435664.1 hypothetical protein [Peptostreptococcus porci]
MTNLEFYKDEIYEMQRDLFDKGLCISDSIGVAICNVCKKQTGLSAFMPMVLDWLLEEHKEPIKLKQWEYDLLKCYQETKDDGEFVDHYILKEMQYKGYFQNIDYNLTIEEILDNCEVIEK